MTLQIELTSQTTIPLELESITPQAIHTLSLAEVERLEVFEGNNQACLGDFFRVSGDTAEQDIRFCGDIPGVHWIGTRMASGQITIEGNAGRHLGSEMTGGRIDVMGDTGDWLGAEMTGGLIHVRGRAGHQVGAAYRGSVAGMRGGTILVNGDVGNEVGHSMRRGKIAVGGSAGDLIGFNMLAGTVVVGGEVGIRHGAGMKRGTLIFLGQHPDMLPTFTNGGRHRMLMTTLLSRELAELGYEKAEQLSGEFELYHGDHLEGGRGEVLLSVTEAT